MPLAIHDGLQLQKSRRNFLLDTQEVIPQERRTGSIWQRWWVHELAAQRRQKFYALVLSMLGAIHRDLLVSGSSWVLSSVKSREASAFRHIL